MQGYFDLKALDAGDIPEEEILQAKKEGRLAEVVGNLPVLHSGGGHNMVFDMMAAYMLYKCLSGPTLSVFRSASEGVCSLAHLYLSSTDDEPYYEYYDYGDEDYNQGPGMITGTCVKRFEEDDYLNRFTIDKTGGDGHHSIWFRNEFLWTQSQCVSNVIRAVTVRSSEQCTLHTTGYQQERARVVTARIRLKDERGRNIEFRKTDRMILWLAYTFTLTSY